MSDEEVVREADAEHLRFKLAQGLKACHAIVDNYRLMLGGAANDNGAGELTAGNQPFARADEA